MEKEYPFERAAGMLKIIAHPVRLSIVSLLKSGQMKAGDIQYAVGARQSVTSQHLNVMADKDILKKERVGNEVYYSIKKKEVLKLLECIKGCCSPR